MEAAVQEELVHQGAPGSPDRNKRVDTRWIQWLRAVPWWGEPSHPVTESEIREELDRTHCGMADAKRRISQHAAARSRGGARAALCLTGPPGVGKTSIAKATAKAGGRPLGYVGCGGWRTRRLRATTEHAGPPGAIVRELRRSGCRNPMFLLDEVDKIGPDPAGVLLEILDPAQQGAFRDAFIEFPVDLSDALFITTANDPDRILGPLRDRMEMVAIPAYSSAERVQIGREQLLPKAAAATGLPPPVPTLSAEAWVELVMQYTVEEGVRALERTLETLCRCILADEAKHDGVDLATVARLLGPPPAPADDDPGRLAKRVSDARLPDQARRSAGERTGARRADDDESERTVPRSHGETMLDLPWNGPQETDRPHQLESGSGGERKQETRAHERAWRHNSNRRAGRGPVSGRAGQNRQEHPGQGGRIGAEAEDGDDRLPEPGTREHAPRTGADGAGGNHPGPEHRTR